MVLLCRQRSKLVPAIVRRGHHSPLAWSSVCCSSSSSRARASSRSRSAATSSVCCRGRIVCGEQLHTRGLERQPSPVELGLLHQQALDVLLAVRQPLLELAAPRVQLLLPAAELARPLVEARAFRLELPLPGRELLGGNGSAASAPRRRPWRSDAFSSLRASRSSRRRSSSSPRSRTAIASARDRSVRFSSSSSPAATGGDDGARTQRRAAPAASASAPGSPPRPAEAGGVRPRGSPASRLPGPTHRTAA